MLNRLLQEIVRFASRNPQVVFQVVRTVPLVVGEIDRWISTRSLEVARAQVAEIEKHDVNLLEKIFRERRADMSAEVRKEFEDALRRNGRNV